MKKRFYILGMWQTGNIGSYNIAKIKEQPEDGFLLYRDAEKWLEKNIQALGYWHSFVINMVYNKI